jgi:hypothetical protein
MSIDRPAGVSELLLEYLDATRSSLWVLDPDRFARLRACVEDARRKGDLKALVAFWCAYRIPEDEAIDFNWFDAAGGPLAPEPPIVLACACTAEPLGATQQHAALPLGRIDLLFDPTRPAFSRWLDRQLDLEWHASFLPAREVLRQLPDQLDDSCRASLTDWLYERRRLAGEPPNPAEASSLFEIWSRRYVEEWRERVVGELVPLAARDALLVVFTDY